MQSSTSSSSAGCGTCKFCKSNKKCQTLIPQNFMKVVESSINHRPKSFFVIMDGLTFGNLASIPFDPVVDPGPYVCFNCWESGHAHVECTQPKLQHFCQNCGRKGVITNDCPRCASSYLEFIGMQKMKFGCHKSSHGYEEVKQILPFEFQVYLNHFHDVESIPFDIEVDVPAGNCINCLEPRHPKSKLCDNFRNGDYCFNCGRSGVRVYTCPRCGHAYPSYKKKRDRTLGFDTAKTKTKNRLAICGADDETSNLLIRPTHYSVKKSVPSPYNLYFKALRDIVIQSVDDIKSSTSPKQRVEITDLTDSINGTKSTVSSGIGEEYLSDEEDEDLDQIIVDENEKPQLDRPPSEGVQAFLNLMDAVKYLPIDTQSSVALQFVRKRRVLLNEKKEKNT
ncbi:uncharacterized protein LOC131671344 [Phymastichus coffea]|uniref:uncharacterized protein LOC131671344 n=1 Tax=Phymastichus coffea TaxID=108790 RepID=UPI00273C3F90|nr:uncharacterized protein LOC131671344 [Phymastichus coffea]